MIRLLKYITKGSVTIYGFLSRILHFIRRTKQFFFCRFTGITYLRPRVPSGGYCSQYGQDYYLEKLGLIENGAFFVEVGCNHPVTDSNTYFLETVKNCSGVSIDAIDFSKEFQEFRPQTKFLRLLVSDEIKILEFCHVLNADMMSSINKEILERDIGYEMSEIECALRPIDILFVDVEGHEFSVLKSLDWNIQSPKVICIENNGLYFPRATLVSYLVDKGYSHRARLGFSDDIFVRI
jgi:hypothetical protein